MKRDNYVKYFTSSLYAFDNFSRSTKLHIYNMSLVQITNPINNNKILHLHTNYKFCILCHFILFGGGSRKEQMGCGYGYASAHIWIKQADIVHGLASDPSKQAQVTNLWFRISDVHVLTSAWDPQDSIFGSHSRAWHVSCLIGKGHVAVDFVFFLFRNKSLTRWGGVSRWVTNL